MLNDPTWRQFHQHKFWLPYGNDFWFNDTTKQGALRCRNQSSYILISKEGVFYLYDAVRRQKIRAAFVVLETWTWTTRSIEALPVDKVIANFNRQIPWKGCFWVWTRMPPIPGIGRITPKKPKPIEHEQFKFKL